MDLRVQALIALHPEEFEPLAERWWATFFPQSGEHMRTRGISPREVWSEIASLLARHKIPGFGTPNAIGYHETETVEARITLTAWFRQYGESRVYGESRAIPRNA